MSNLLREHSPLTHSQTFFRGRWDKTIDLKDFVDRNISPYDGDESFLSDATPRTKALWNRVLELLKDEQMKQGVLDADEDIISTLTSHPAAYIDRDNEIIVGLQTSAPLRRGIKPFGGVRVVEKALSEFGYTLSPAIVELFTTFRKTHNDAVFQSYTEQIKAARKAGYITGLPDTYARGRIIGDYRRLALYGADFLIQQKEDDLRTLEEYPFNEEIVKLREEVSDQISALRLLKEMAALYGFNVSNHAETAKEAIQYTYFAFLGAVKEQDGAAMSLGNVSSFFDIYIERDMKRGLLSEEEAQELIDDFVIKLRLVRHLRPQAYNDIFAGDPTWVTEAIGGMLDDGRHKITKTAYRMLHTLKTLGPSPEPNLTVLWSPRLPENFKRYATKMAIESSSIQFENDELMRPLGTDDYGIACCVSLQQMGKSMQFFGARCNLPKTLLLAINEGRDEMTGEKMLDGIEALSPGPLKIEEVSSRLQKVLKWLIKLYVETMNIIHAKHDRYYYERLQMALLDTFVQRNMAFGIAGLSVATDSMSAIRYAKVTPLRDQRGIAVDFEIEGDFPKYGNDDDRADGRAIDLIRFFSEELKKHTIYRNATPTLSILTITSNVMYGKKTGATPDGRKKGQPFAPGANPMHGRDENGALASLNSVAKLPYQNCLDGISNTFSVLPSILGSEATERSKNLIALLDGYFIKGGHHLNVNVIEPSMLKDAMDHPEKYPQLTIRVSGYAVHFNKLSREQQEEVLARTFHKEMG
ncbi:MAG: formate C-acetyltransferase [Spirochaetales bacterium]|nr:formate C-acetyltransferase [Spirochaetales bacterium]